MNNRTLNWKLLHQPFDKHLLDALQQQHHAAQFIAMVGKYLLPPEDDDSNTNMQYINGTNSVYGNLLPNGMQLGLNLAELKLFLSKNSEITGNVIELNGKTKVEVFTELKDLLNSSGLDAGSLKTELHYEIPKHELDKNAVFSTVNKQALEENAIYRHNAESILKDIAAGEDKASTVRIWPHHFDTGIFIPEEVSNGRITKSIGAGLAIPDGMVSEPYFYLSFWSEAPSGQLQFPSLPAGKWMMPGWNGAVLGLSDILKLQNPDEQRALVKMFFKNGIEIIRKASA